MVSLVNQRKEMEPPWKWFGTARYLDGRRAKNRHLVWMALRFRLSTEFEASYPFQKERNYAFDHLWKIRSMQAILRLSTIRPFEVGRGK